VLPVPGYRGNQGLDGARERGRGSSGATAHAPRPSDDPWRPRRQGRCVRRARWERSRTSRKALKSPAAYRVTRVQDSARLLAQGQLVDSILQDSRATTDHVGCQQGRLRARPARMIDRTHGPPPSRQWVPLRILSDLPSKRVSTVRSAATQLELRMSRRRVDMGSQRVWKTGGC
jgi:hypothetical protein